MTHFFEKRDLWGNRLSLWIVVLMAFAAPLCGWSIRQMHFDGDVEKQLADNDSEILKHRWTHEQFPIGERILLTWDDSSINDPRVGQLVEQLTGKLDEHGVNHGGLPYISSVIEPATALNNMQRNGIEPHEAVRRLEGTILGAGPLRLRLTETGRSAMRKTKREIQKAVEANFGLELTVLDASPDLSSLTSIPAYTEAGQTPKEPIPPALLSVDGQLAAETKLDHDLQVTWKGMRIGSDATIAVANWLTKFVPQRGDGEPLVESTFFAPGSPIALSIGISEAGLADKMETVGAIRTACNRIGIPSDSIHMAGNVVAATELNQQILKAVWDTSFPLVEFHRRSVLLTSGLVCAFLAYVLLRNFRLATVVVLTSFFAMACGMAIIPLSGGQLNSVMIALPILLIASTMAGAIHMTNYWKHAACRDATTAVVNMVRMAWAPCFLTSFAIGIGFISLSTSKLIPLREFGLYAAAGATFSLAMVLYGLPSLMQTWSLQPPKERELEHTGWRMFGQLLTVRPGLQSLVVIAACIGCGLGLARFRAETKVFSDFSNQAKITQDYWFIENNVAGISPIETIIRFDQQAQKDMNFLERMELVRQLQEKIRQHPEISGSESLATTQPIGEQAPEDVSFLQKTKFNKRASAVEQRFRDGEVPGTRSFYTVSETGQDLEKPGDALLNKAGDELWRISANVMTMTDNDLPAVLADLHSTTQDVLKLHPGSHHLITGNLPIYLQTQKIEKQSLISSSVMAFALILGMLIFRLRSFGAAVVAMVPNVAPMVVVFGVISWTRQHIDLSSMVTMPIVLGISVGSTLHLITWMQLAMKSGKPRHEAVIDAMAKCGPSIWQTMVIVAIGLLALGPAELLVISRFGWLTASMAGVACFANLVLMPQLLGSPFGWFFEPVKLVEVKAEIEEIVEIEETVAVITEPSLEEVPQDAPVPEPHIKPHDPAAKKGRRASSRRDRDAG